MTTQTAQIYLSGPDGGRRFSATATDAAFTEITSETGARSLWEILRGKRIEYAGGQFAAGVGAAQVRNTQTNKIKAVICMDVIGEERYHKIDPFTVEENDIIEAYVDVA